LKTLGLAAVVLILIPFTILFGNIYFGERRYFFIGLMIILEIIVPFIFSFENNRPKAREIVLLSVLCALAVASREAFFMLSHFKPIIAIVIISGICFGGETGFLVGAMSAFVSNFFFGQGPWTVWQMFATGTVGFTAGIVFRFGILPKSRGAIFLFGGITTLIIYGGIMDPASVLMWQANPTWQIILDAYLAGLAFNITLAASTMFFLWLFAIPMIEKLERVKTKYNIMK
ncbi:MAG: ECF transporter S component, partial [Monoglobales bacterium]